MRDIGLRALLTQHPDALVFAIHPDARPVPVPSSLPLGGHRVPQVRSGLDLVRAEDRPAVIAAWGRVVAHGFARVEVELDGTPDGRVVAHFFDVTPQHGAVVVVVVPTDGRATAIEQVLERTRPPRFVRARKNEVAVYLDVGPEITAMLGWTREEMIGHPAREFIHPDDVEVATERWIEALQHPGATTRVRARHRHREGHWIWLDVANHNLLHDPDRACMDCEMLDISDEMAAIEAVRSSEQLLRRLAEALPVGVVQFGLDFSIVFANEALYRIIGAEPGTANRVLRERVEDLGSLRAALVEVLEGTDVDIELRLDRRDGAGTRQCTFALRTLTTTEGEVTGAVGCLTDVTESSRLRSELEQRAAVDPLTGCMNRTVALATLADALLDRRHGTAVMFVDLDGFKSINDEFGHGAGDRVLIAVAERLRDAARVGDVVGRLGGDEFLVICPDVVDGSAAQALANRVASLVVRPLDLDPGTASIRPSIGVAWASGGDVVDAEALVAAADQAMYRSNRTGAGTPVLAGPRDVQGSRPTRPATAVAARS